LMGIIVWLYSLFDANGVIAFFTAVLAISTIALWSSTKRAARSAERSASIAEQALVSLERPFIFVKEIDLFTERAIGPMSASGHNVPGRITTYRISAILENGGQSPAIRVIYNFNCGLIAAHNIDTFDFPDQGNDSRAVIGPKATLHTASQSISAASVGQIVAGVDRWFIWGWVDYDDIFIETKRHRTEFCFEVTARRLPNAEIVVGFSMHRRFNATDDDCLRKSKPYSPMV
jgi:hypothetical protein